MRKKTLALAVATALVVPAAHAEIKGDDNVVELYGRVYPEIIIPHGSGATDAGATVATFAGKPTGEDNIIRRTEISSSNSRVGVRGQERLGGDLKAIFQLETEFHVDSNDSAFAQRDSFVGLADKRWGTIKLGRMDTPFKTFGDDISFLGVGSGNFVSSSNVLRKTGFGTSSASSFHLRRANVIQYESPEWAGFDFAGQYSTDETDTQNRHPHVWSFGAEYDRGPLKVSLAHEEHWDLFGLSKNVPSSMSNTNDPNVNSKDKATQAMVQFKVGPHKFEGDWIRKEYNENATVTGRASSYKNNAYQLIWSARWTKAWRTDLEYIKSFKGSCSRVNAACSTDGLDGSQLQAGFSYYFSPRTYIFVMGAILRNGFSARYNNEDLQSPSVGEDITQWAVGMNHSF
ncbi:MAG TPA: porin [Usitatibacter sp.]|nr:porin [Usitatibacter sp.]